MKNNNLQLARISHKKNSQQGQALAEMTIGLIALAVVFLGILMIGELSRARMAVILEAREEAGPLALAGSKVGNPKFYSSSGDSVERLKTSVLDATETPIAYSQYTPTAYPYMEKNFVSGLYNSESDNVINNFYLTYVEKTRYVTNDPFLYRMGVGPGIVTVTQKACLPVMQGFP